MPRASPGCATLPRTRKAPSERAAVIDKAIRPAAVASAPVPAPTPTPPDRTPQATATAHPFAEMLRQNRLAAATPAAPATPSTPAEKADARPAPADAGESNQALSPDSAAPQRDATQAKARLGGASRQAPQSAQAPAPLAEAPADGTHAKESDSKDAPTVTPDASLIAGALASARPDVAPRTEAQGGDSGAAAPGKAATASDVSGARATAPPFDASSPQDATTGTATDPRAALAAADASAGSDARAEPSVEAPAGPLFAGVLAETGASHATTASSATGHTNNDAAASTVQAAAFMGNITPGAGSAVAASTLSTPVHSPDFAAAFGMQVSVLAKDGVQQAELHLNPAEMGPVSILITLDGTQARVDFGADAAATRHAIEAGLPELASALRDAGFTLAGGGVAQHSGSNGSNGGDADPNRPGPSRGASNRPTRPDATTQRLTRHVAAGGVDLYA